MAVTPNGYDADRLDTDDDLGGWDDSDMDRSELDEGDCAESDGFEASGCSVRSAAETRVALIVCRTTSDTLLPRRNTRSVSISGRRLRMQPRDGKPTARCLGVNSAKTS